jgi:hypothetical protein
VLLAALAAALVAGALPAGALALDECRGLPQCVSVLGPWVVVPGRTDGGLATATWDLRCPLPGYVVGGTDARATTRTVEVSIRGEKGSPVSPGVTTRRSVVFSGRRQGAGTAAFLPAIGCLPSDGGGGRSQTSVRRAGGVVQPGAPFVRKVVVGRLRRGASVTVAARCPSGGRVLDVAHAVGFRTKAPPTAAQRAGVSTRALQSRSVVLVRGTLTAAVGSARVLLQVQLTCTRGAR